MDIRVTFPSGKRVDAELVGKGVVVRSDQASVTGEPGSAPEPYQLFLASIGTCAGAYVLSFCLQRSLPTDGIELLQQQQYDESGKRLAKVTITIKLPSGIPQKYHRALVRAAELCAVKRAITDPPEFEVKVNTG
jgi:putative redox protein